MACSTAVNIAILTVSATERHLGLQLADLLRGVVLSWVDTTCSTLLLFVTEGELHDN